MADWPSLCTVAALHRAPLHWSNPLHAVHTLLCVVVCLQNVYLKILVVEGGDQSGYPSGPSKCGRDRLDVRLGKIARVTPAFFDFARLFVILGTFTSVILAVWQTVQQRFQCALNHKKTTKSLKLEFCPSLRPSNARIFVQKVPVFRPSFYKNEPVWRIGNTVLQQIVYLIRHINMHSFKWTKLLLTLPSFPSHSCYRMIIRWHSHILTLLTWNQNLKNPSSLSSNIWDKIWPFCNF